MAAWIKMVSAEEASSNLKEVLTMAKTPHGTVDNVIRVHSLRPETMRGHLVLYRAVLHDDENTIPQWFQETIGSYVSILNHCEYSLSNHWRNACHLIDDTNRSNNIKIALEARCPERDLGSFVKVSPITFIVPPSWFSNRFIHLTNVDFPDPDGPTKAIKSPRFIFIFTFSNRSIIPFLCS